MVEPSQLTSVTATVILVSHTNIAHLPIPQDATNGGGERLATDRWLCRRQCGVWMKSGNRSLEGSTLEITGEGK